MSDSVKPARMLIGGPSGCVGYTQEELRVLNEVLNSGVSLRNTVVHRAIRIMCQAIINNPDGGYPSSLWELERIFGLQSKAPQPAPAPPALSAQADRRDSQIEGTPSWMLESRSEGMEVPEPAVSPAPQEEVDPEVLKQRHAISSFMG